MKINNLGSSLGFLLLISLAACGIFSPQPVIIPPDQLGTAIVETSAVLASQTAEAAPPVVPTNTSLPTQTSLATSTQTETATWTPFHIIVPTFTGTVTPTRTATASKTPTKTLNQPCMLMAQMPANNTQFSPSAFFDTVWTVVNTGSVTWQVGNVDFVYIGGQKFHLGGDVIDLPATTGPGQSLALIVHDQAPSTKGTYGETWNLKQGATIYCTLTVTIIVK